MRIAKLDSLSLQAIPYRVGTVPESLTDLHARQPGHHVIADTLDMSIAIALNLDEVAELGWIQLEKKTPTPMTWDSYCWLRAKIIARSNDLASEKLVVAPIDVKRALYTLGQKVGDAKNGTNLIWSAYAQLVESIFQGV